LAVEMAYSVRTSYRIAQWSADKMQCDLEKHTKVQDGKRILCILYWPELLEQICGNGMSQMPRVLYDDFQNRRPKAKEGLLT
jgi:hypothetical protein